MTEQKENGSEQPLLERVALGAPRYIGSPVSLILHTIFFVGIFGLQFVGFGFDQIMLILTTVVSLEAIYLSIFIQMTVNHQAKQIEEVSEDVEEISEDVEGISEDVEEISKDIDDIQEDMEDISEDVEEISKDIDDIQEDVKEIGEDVDEISEDVEDLGEELEKDDKEYSADRSQDVQKIEKIESVLEELLREVKGMKK